MSRSDASLRTNKILTFPHNTIQYLNKPSEEKKIKPLIERKSLTTGQIHNRQQCGYGQGKPVARKGQWPQWRPVAMEGQRPIYDQYCFSFSSSRCSGSSRFPPMLNRRWLQCAAVRPWFHSPKAHKCTQINTYAIMHAYMHVCMLYMYVCSPLFTRKNTPYKMGWKKATSANK